ncbi:ankyrin repeat-containing domain protein [Xylariales sp. PMI_506]|nr:ankyrin repeat-containing domain protein [Xylariales sp. PMI_506]
MTISCLEHRGRRTYPYDALSYVWSGNEKPRSIIVNEQDVLVTKNLYMALLRLRYSHGERYLWIDAICINQEDDIEKEHQIKIMPDIYGQAKQVVIWLGGVEGNCDRALEQIWEAGSTKSGGHIDDADIDAICTLFNRPWFKRIWVLQEVAAARSVIMICGATEISSAGFCSSVDVLMASPEYHALDAIRSLIFSITLLIRRASLRPRNVGVVVKDQSLCILLAELIDMYHGHEATISHDKIYALLGISSDASQNNNLAPNYSLDWGILFNRLAKFIFPEGARLEIMADGSAVAMRCTGRVLGRVSDIGEDPDSAANRPCGAHLSIITIAANISADQNVFSHVTNPIRDFVLVWNWKQERIEQESFGTFDPDDVWLTNATELWGYGLILGDAKYHDEAELSIRRAIKDYEVELGMEESNISYSLGGITRLSWAALNGYISEVKILLGSGLEKDLVDRQGLSPLCHAAGNGHEGIVKLLLAAGAAVGSGSKFDLSPLLNAVNYGHFAIVKLLLAAGATVDSKYNFDTTPLLRAAGKGYQAIVRLLLVSDAAIDSMDTKGSTPLSYAAENGQETIVKLLLTAGAAADPNNLEMPLSCAAENSHEAIVELLLNARPTAD